MAGGGISELPSDWQTLPTSREAAKAAGVKFYFNGKPCRWAKHIAPRYVSVNKCVLCQSAASRRWADKDRLSYRAKANASHARCREKSGEQRRARYWSDPEAARRACMEKYYEKHEHNKALARDRRARNPEQYREYIRRGRRKNKEKIADYNKRYKEQNPHIYAAAAMARYTRLRNALPEWADLDEIRDFYEKAKRLTSETGVKYQVDHIIPLQGDNVCGLHVPWNLQVITKSENVRKSNRLLEEFM